MWSSSTVQGIPTVDPNVDPSGTLIVPLVSRPSVESCVGVGTEASTGSPLAGEALTFSIITSDGGATWRAAPLGAQVAWIGSLSCSSISNLQLPPHWGCRSKRDEMVIERGNSNSAIGPTGTAISLDCYRRVSEKISMHQR